MRSHQGLAKTQASISGRHFGVGEYLESRGRKPRFEGLRQIDIVEGPAAQAHAAQPSSPTQTSREFDEYVY